MVFRWSCPNAHKVQGSKPESARSAASANVPIQNAAEAGHNGKRDANEFSHLLSRLPRKNWEVGSSGVFDARSVQHEGGLANQTALSYGPDC